MVRRLLLGISLLAGCEAYELPLNQETEPPAGAATATAFAWEALGMGEAALPPIHWVEGRCLEFSADAACASGTDGRHYTDGVGIWLVTDRPSASALVHELHHEALWQTHGNSDPNHDRADWSVVEPIRDELRQRNL